jgi:hypothetical protein
MKCHGENRPIVYQHQAPNSAKPDKMKFNGILSTLALCAVARAELGTFRYPIVPTPSLCYRMPC